MAQDIRTIVKLALRLTSAAYDDEVDGLVAAAKDDLMLSGVGLAALTADELAPLIVRAIVLYSRAEFGLDNPDSEKFGRSYRMVAEKLAMSSEYRQPVLSGITGDIEAGSCDLVVSDSANLEAGAWLGIEGAGADGALLVARVDAVDEDTAIVTLSRPAGTTVEEAPVKLL